MEPRYGVVLHHRLVEEAGMTPRMRDFLQRAAKADKGRGIMVKHYDRTIAGRAVSSGFGWMIYAPLRVFIITDTGRAEASS